MTIDKGRLEGLLEKATDGPWLIDDGDVGAWAVFTKALGDEVARCWDGPWKDEVEQANAELIALTPTLAEAYLKQCGEIERLRAALSSARDLISSFEGVYEYEHDNQLVTDELKRIDAALSTDHGRGE